MQHLLLGMKRNTQREEFFFGPMLIGRVSEMKEPYVLISWRKEKKNNFLCFRLQRTLINGHIKRVREGEMEGVVLQTITSRRLLDNEQLKSSRVVFGIFLKR
jgi:hypothetical protein